MGNWKAESTPSSGIHGWAVVDGDQRIATAASEALARRIVLACNAHDDLLEACKGAEWVPCMDQLAAFRCPSCANARKNGHRHDCKLKQAIDKAEGKEVDRE
jgi:hypothetical protein